MDCPSPSVCSIRPLHEFLPHGGEESKLLARTLGMQRADLSRIVESLRETNPMLGHRGCRLGITYPEITEMQGRAIFEAAVRAKRRGLDVRPEIMIPLVAVLAEFENQRDILRDVAKQVLGGMGEDVRLFHWNDDRTAAGGTDRGRDCNKSRVLFVWNQ